MKHSGGSVRRRGMTATENMTMTTATRGHDAIRTAECEGIERLWKYTDPTEEARWVTLDEAREIVLEDPELIDLRAQEAPR